MQRKQKTKRSRQTPPKTIHRGIPKNKTKTTLGPVTLFGDISPKVLLLCFWILSMSLILVALTSLVVLFFGCPNVSWYPQLGSWANPLRRRRICLYIFSLLHPLLLTRSSLISQRIAHSPPLDLNIDVASETCVPAIRMIWGVGNIWYVKTWIRIIHDGVLHHAMTNHDVVNHDLLWWNNTSYVVIW